MPRHRFARLYAIETNPHAVADLICHNATRALGLNCAASDERTALARTGPLAKFTVRPWRERYEQAVRNAERGRDLVALQRALIDRQKALGQDASWLERGLDLFEKSQILFERDLERIRHERR